MLTKSENQPHALGYAAGETLRSENRSGKPCQSPAMANGRCRMHGGPSPGAPKGNQHAYKHGRYTAEALEPTQIVRDAGNDEGPNQHGPRLNFQGLRYWEYRACG